jgi:hypothetical protein
MPTSKLRGKVLKSPSASLRGKALDALKNSESSLSKSALESGYDGGDRPKLRGKLLEKYNPAFKDSAGREFFEGDRATLVSESGNVHHGVVTSIIPPEETKGKGYGVRLEYKIGESTAKANVFEKGSKGINAWGNRMISEDAIKREEALSPPGPS